MWLWLSMNVVCPHLWNEREVPSVLVLSRRPRIPLATSRRTYPATAERVHGERPKAEWTPGTYSYSRKARKQGGTTKLRERKPLECNGFESHVPLLRFLQWRRLVMGRLMKSE